MKKIKLNRKKVIIWTLSIIAVVCIGVVITLTICNKNRQSKKLWSFETVNKTIEIYTEVPQATDYIKSLNTPSLTISKDSLQIEYLDSNNQITKLPTEKIDGKKVANKLGNYQVHLYNKEGTIDQKVILSIVDTTAPILTLKDVTLTKGQDITAESFVENCTDNSKTECHLAFAQETIPNAVGEHEIVIKASDDSGNETIKTAKLFVKENLNKTANTIGKTSKGYDIVTKNGVTYINGVLVVNKTYSLPSNYGNGLTTETLTAFNKMKQEASNSGLSLSIVSGFRSYDYQRNLYNRYVNEDGQAAADTYSARPGHSEHQSGLAFDLNWVDNAFKNTHEGQWLFNNAYKYGFILRYPENKTAETGYIFEPWHYRYVGIDLATRLYNGGNWITLEDYFGITSNYS